MLYTVSTEHDAYGAPGHSLTGKRPRAGAVRYVVESSQVCKSRRGGLIIAVVVIPDWGHVDNAERCPSPA